MPWEFHPHVAILFLQDALANPDLVNSEASLLQMLQKRGLMRGPLFQPLNSSMPSGLVTRSSTISSALGAADSAFSVQSDQYVPWEQHQKLLRSFQILQESFDSLMLTMPAGDGALLVSSSANGTSGASSSGGHFDAGAKPKSILNVKKGAAAGSATWHRTNAFVETQKDLAEEMELMSKFEDETGDGSDMTAIQLRMQLALPDEAGDGGDISASCQISSDDTDRILPTHESCTSAFCDGDTFGGLFVMCGRENKEPERSISTLSQLEGRLSSDPPSPSLSPQLAGAGGIGDEGSSRSGRRESPINNQDLNSDLKSAYDRLLTDSSAERDALKRQLATAKNGARGMKVWHLFAL